MATAFMLAIELKSASRLGPSLWDWCKLLGKEGVAEMLFDVPFRVLVSSNNARGKQLIS